METLKFDLSKKCGGFKPMNAVNNGPIFKRHANDQYRTNIEEYKAAKIPYARNHDAAFYLEYGGEHSVDISAIFPNFDADPYAEGSYDFVCTDEYIKVTALAGTKTFYRLGQKIEHYIKKFSTLPPKDFEKWAVVCEHIIKHYTEGWANGFDAGIEYWEIWAEPDLGAGNSSDGSSNDSPNKRMQTWGGTRAEFFNLYEITAKRLKKAFPKLKIGGPAISWDEQWTADFLGEMRKRNVPIDFFSWHCYCHKPEEMAEKALRIRKILDENGYCDSESILDEYNYVRGWTEEYIYSIEVINSIKGAAFTAACMAAAQKAPVDMLMYYDASPCYWNGLFNYYTLRPQKGYYPFLWFSKLSELEEVQSENEIENIYTLCGKTSDGKVSALVTYYTDDDLMPNKTVKLDFGKDSRYLIYALDNEKTNELVGETRSLTFDMKPNSCIFVVEK